MEVVSDVERAWFLADCFFEQRLKPDALLEKPIDLRNPFLFYLGHLPAFAWNQVRRELDLQQFNPEYDDLFERGMDPDVDDPSKCHAHSEAPPAWPSVAQVTQYRDKVREMFRTGDVWARLSGTHKLQMIAEHEYMHIETLMYMLSQLGAPLKHGISEAVATRRAVRSEYIAIPAGRATLGTNHCDFGWDNEFPEMTAHVPAFEIKNLPVTIGEYLGFVEGGGYEKKELWNTEDWRWRIKHNIEHPKSWRRGADGNFLLLYPQGAVPTADVPDLPVFASLAEARAFARYVGARLPTEAEWQRAAYGRPDGGENAQPWGQDAPRPGHHGNFGFVENRPTAVGSYPAGRSALGIDDLVGNGWELCDTGFSPFPGFRVSTDYPGYSADFFDGKHFVLKGASWATEPRLIRRSFRNWYQAHYPYVFSKFRLVKNS